MPTDSFHSKMCWKTHMPWCEVWEQTSTWMEQESLMFLDEAFLVFQWNGGDSSMSNIEKTLSEVSFLVSIPSISDQTQSWTCQRVTLGGCWGMPGEHPIQRTVLKGYALASLLWCFFFHCSPWFCWFVCYQQLSPTESCLLCLGSFRLSLHKHFSQVQTPLSTVSLFWASSLTWDAF